jgi:nicotinamide-nucleotide amidase
MPERNLKQATLIPSARAIPNARGSAPGWWIKRDDGILLAMPGPPEEMQGMWEREIRDELRRTLCTAIIVSRTLKIFGLPEAKVDELVSPFLSSANPTIGIYARPSGIELRLTAKACDQGEAKKMIAPLEEQIRSIIGDHIWGSDDQTMEKLVGDLLQEKGLTLATMESCTGGRLADLLTDVPGSSRYFKGGLVAYSDEMKAAFGVAPELISQHGAVSSPVAEAMAVAVRSCLGTDIGMATTGVAGPEGIEGKPVGMVYIGIADGTIARSKRIIFPQHRQRIKHYAAIWALSELRRFLSDAQ